jgi:serine/threonine protein phosphatase PrpC
MSNTSAISLDVAAATDIGCQRSNNEDYFGYDTDLHIYVVCDGMGGSAAGEVASSMAVRALLENYAELSLGGISGEPAPLVEERLSLSIHAANRIVRQAAEFNEQLRSMGTTLVCTCLDGARAVVGNVGDSRAHLVRNGVCLQVTLDHSLIDEQLRHGLITPEAAAISNLQSVITRAIGVADIVEPDLFAVELQLDDRFLLASDGLTRYVRPEEIGSAAATSTDLTAICNSLIELAKERGGADNITCMLLRVVGKASSE